jgi:hypothetical protein
MKLPTDGFRSKSWDEFAAPGAPPLHFVITVCDKAAGELCPVWPGQPITAHWGVEDPAAVQGTDEARRTAFKNALVVLTRRIELLLNLPIEKLDRLALAERLVRIGKGRFRLSHVVSQRLRLRSDSRTCIRAMFLCAVAAHDPRRGRPSRRPLGAPAPLLPPRERTILSQ